MEREFDLWLERTLREVERDLFLENNILVDATPPSPVCQVLLDRNFMADVLDKSELANEGYRKGTGGVQ